MTDPTTRDWEDDLVAIAERAGAEIMDVYTSEDFGVESKDDRTPLTKADLRAEEAIQDGLADVAPDVPVLSEESEDLPYGTRQDWDHLWVVDPLDGTKEFIKQNDEFTVNIALVDGRDPVAGVVHVPATGRTFFAQDGEAVVLEDGSRTELTTDPLDEGRPVRVVASRSHLDDETKAFVDEIGDVELVRTGSSLKFCRIAEGQADLYPRFAPTMEWDTAAAQAVLEAAGGAVRRRDGGPLRYNKERLRNPQFVAAGDPSWFG